MRLPIIDDPAPSGRAVALIVAALIALRMVCASFTPLAFDEAYYWTWSKHLAGGYYDHPPMVALVVRLGTMIAGDTEFGVRLVSMLLAVPMSFAVYRAASILFPGRRLAADAVILLNATMMVAAGTVIVTPDAPLMAASAFVLLGLAKVVETGRGLWWLATGAAVGAALLSKYTALFFGPVILIWLLAVPAQRRWLATPWPYLGGLVAFALFTPVILWNAQHQWVSFLKQFGRARIDEGFAARYILELIPAQFGFATPFVFILSVMGLYLLAMRRAGQATGRVLVNATVWVITGYFVWHSLHARVEANWFGPIYPALALAAALAANHEGWSAQARRVVDFCRRWALPTSIVILLALVLQANTGALNGNRRDGTARTIGAGWSALAPQIEDARIRSGAACVLGNDYVTTAWLAFYLPKGSCVTIRAERIRWVNTPDPAPQLLAGKVLFVDDALPDGGSILSGMPAYAASIGRLERRRGGLMIDTFQLDLLDGAKGEILDLTPPPELSR